MARMMALLTGMVAIGVWGNALPLLALTPVPPQWPLLAQNNNAPLNLAVLKNAAYDVPDLGQVTLRNGQYLGNNLNLSLIKPLALGDVDADGDQDAAVILQTQSSSGPEQLVYLAVVTADGAGNVTNPDTYFLGDRVRVQSLTIKNGQVRLNILKHQAGDPLCCPSGLVSEAYQLDDTAGTLKPVTLSEQERQGIHIQDLPSQELPGDQDQPFQPPLDGFEIRL